MFDKRSQRLCKELLLKLNRWELPVYYFPWIDVPARPEDMWAQTDLIHGLDTLPLPECPCIILAENKCFIDDGIIAFVVEPTGLSDVPYLLDTWFAVVRDTRACVVRYRSAEPKTRVRHGPTLAESSREVLHATGLGALTVSSELRGSTMLPFMPPADLGWTSCEGDFWPVWMMVSLMRHIAIPSHYFVRSRSRDGFGPGSARRASRGKPIISVVNHDRLYAVYKGVLGDIEITPHFRRGHMRYLWKDAGLDRFTLPSNPLDRARLIHEHNVRGIYISAMWVGDRIVEDESFSHEAITEVHYQGLRPVFTKESRQ